MSTAVPLLDPSLDGQATQGYVNASSGNAAPPAAGSSPPVNHGPSSSVQSTPNMASSMRAGTSGSGGASNFPKLSATTEEILKRITANASAHAGSQGWEAAREQVLKSMVTSENTKLPPLPQTVRKRVSKYAMPSESPVPEGTRAGVAGNGTADDVAAQAGPVNGGVGKSSTAANGKDAAEKAKSTPRPSARGKDSTRGRGRGKGKGKKRRRTDDDDDDDDESDISVSYTPKSTQTKSGRNVHKPAQFVPTPPSQSPHNYLKRRRARKPLEQSVCRICQRGVSPPKNQIVFCDACNTAYHQWCHSPPIDSDVVLIEDKEWLCRNCMRARELNFRDMEGLVNGDELTQEAKRTYFSSLPHERLVQLLLYAAAMHPTLTLFPPDTIARLRSVPPVPRPTNGALAPPAPPNPIPIIAAGAASSSSVASNIFVAAPVPSTIAAPDPPAATSPAAPPATATSILIPSSPSSSPPDPDADADGDGSDDDLRARTPPSDGDDDPAKNYPRPGQGVASTLRPEAEDAAWLVEEGEYGGGDGGEGGAAEGKGKEQARPEPKGFTHMDNMEKVARLMKEGIEMYKAGAHLRELDADEEAMEYLMDD